MTVDAEVRLDYVEFSYVEGGIRLSIDGDQLVRYEDADTDGYLEYLLDSTLSELLAALETVVREGTPATARASGTSMRVDLAPVDADRVRISVRDATDAADADDTDDADADDTDDTDDAADGPTVHPGSAEGYVVDVGRLCEAVLGCAREVAAACEADTEAMDWPEDLSSFDRAGESHPLRERVASLEAALDERS